VLHTPSSVRHTPARVALIRQAWFTWEGSGSSVQLFRPPQPPVTRMQTLEAVHGVCTPWHTPAPLHASLTVQASLSSQLAEAALKA
jgi:hypothetical protein